MDTSDGLGLVDEIAGGVARWSFKGFSGNPFRLNDRGVVRKFVSALGVVTEVVVTLPCPNVFTGVAAMKGFIRQRHEASEQRVYLAPIR